MKLLNRDQVKALVIKALERVANVPANVEDADFDQMVEFQRRVFIEALKAFINDEPVIDGDENVFYDIDLNMDSFDDWPTVGACIDWVLSNHRITFKN